MGAVEVVFGDEGDQVYDFYGTFEGDCSVRTSLSLLLPIHKRVTYPPPQVRG
jgi:hypothetical protein